jgi:tetratricopeptide (TPR) repeat protein
MPMPLPSELSLNYILPLLQSRQFPIAITLLEELTRKTPHDADVHFNLGLAYSETQQYPEAVIALKRAAELEPLRHQAWVAIGVAYMYLHRPADARGALEQALRIKPGDPLALQNLAGVLGELGDLEAAAEAARVACAANRPNPTSLWVLAENVRKWAVDQRAVAKRDWLLSEASDAYKHLLKRYPDSPMAEDAEKALTLIAEITLRANAVGGFRPDVFEYIVHALKMFDEMGPHRRNHVVLEIAKVGADGLDINNPERRHAIKGLPGDYTCLQLVAFLFTGMQQIQPSVAVGVDFSGEHEAAIKFLGRTATQPPPI